MTPYRVRHDETTPDEPHAGWYWTDEADEIHGPFNSRDEAEEAIDNHKYQQLTESEA